MNKLPFTTALAFTKHMRSCEKCMDELKAYFMFYSSIRYLDEKNEDIIPHNVESLLEKIEDTALLERKKRRNYLISLLAFLGSVIVLTILFMNGQFF